jgi:hypothetical protein
VPIKSPAPAICHCVETTPETDTRLKHAIFENPNGSRTGGGVFPYQICLAVAEEVADSRNICQLGSMVEGARLDRKTPFCNIQIVRCPVVIFSHTRSAKPSPLKSPAPTICQPPARVGREIAVQRWCDINCRPSRPRRTMVKNESSKNSSIWSKLLLVVDDAPRSGDATKTDGRGIDTVL